MKRVAIIPARGGSKRIPRKNIKDFLGKPIIAYSIQAARESGLFDEVMVSTDDDEVAEVAQRYGAQIPFMRSIKNADDFATTADVLSEVLKNYEEQGTKFDYGCCIYPTAPLIQVRLLAEAFDLLVSKGYNTAFPVTAFTYPILRALRLDSDGRVQMKWPEYLRSRSQDLPEAYHDAGQFYWFRVEAFKTEKRMFGSNTGAIALTDLEVQDIDNETDWKLAELKYQLLSTK